MATAKQIRKHSRRILWSAIKLAFHGAAAYAVTGVAGPKWAAAANAAELAAQELQAARQSR